jgi:hypothetical protein
VLVAEAVAEVVPLLAGVEEAPQSAGAPVRLVTAPEGLVLGPEALGQEALVSGALAPEGLVPALQREAFAPVALVQASEA